MSNYSNTKATIAANVYTNHLNQVTAEMVKTAINSVVDTLIAGGYLYKGVAHPADAAISPDANVFYLATEVGTYTNFGSLVVADGEVAVLKYNGSWSKEVTGAATAAQVSALGQYVDNPEYVKTILDSEGNVLFGIKANGDITLGSTSSREIAHKIERLEEIDSPQYVFLILDPDDRIVMGVDKFNRVTLGNFDISDVLRDYATKDYVDAFIASLELADTNLTTRIQATERELARVEDEAIFTEGDIENIVGDVITERWSAPEIVTHNVRTQWDIVFAAQDSSPEDIALADFVVGTDNAQQVIQGAIDSWFASDSNRHGLNCLFCDGTYYMTHFIEPTDEVNAPFYCIRMPHCANATERGWFYVHCNFSGMRKNVPDRAKFVLKDSAYILYADNTTGPLVDFKNDSSIYQAADSYGPGRYINDYKRFCVFRCKRNPSDNNGGANYCSYKMEFNDLQIVCGDSESITLSDFPIIMIDAIHSSVLEVNNCFIKTSYSGRPIYTFSATFNEGFSGIRCPRGQSWGAGNTMKSNYITRFYNGIEMGSEHWLVEDTVCQYCYFGISRGTYHDPSVEGSTSVAGSEHCNVLNDCGLERCKFLMGFFANGPGWTSGGSWKVNGLSIEWKAGVEGTTEFSRGCFVEKRVINGTTYTNYPKGSFDIQNKPWVETTDGYDSRGVERQFFSSRIAGVVVNVIDSLKVGTSAQFNLRVGEHGNLAYFTDTKKWMIWNDFPEDAGEHSADDYAWGDSAYKACYYGKWESLT